MHGELNRTAELRNLCIQFATEATKIGVNIISELFADPNEKKIVSVTKNFGGVAGGEEVNFLLNTDNSGEKFLRNGIFFKVN